MLIHILLMQIKNSAFPFYALLEKFTFESDRLSQVNEQMLWILTQTELYGQILIFTQKFCWQV